MKKIKEQAEKAYCDFFELKKDALAEIKKNEGNDIVMNIQINRIIAAHAEMIRFSDNEYEDQIGSLNGFLTKSNKSMAFEAPRSAKLYDVLSEFIDSKKDYKMIESIISLVEQYAELYK